MIPPRYLFVIPFLFDCSITGAALVVNLHAQDLGASSFQLGLLGTTWGIAYCVATLSSGAVLDHLSRRALGMIGLSLFTGYIFVSSLAKTPQTLTHLCLIAGLGAGVFWPTFETLLHSRDDNRLTSRNMGFFNVGWTLGIATGVGSGGYLKVWGAVPGLHLLTVLNLLTIALFAYATRRGIPRSEYARSLQESHSGETDEPSLRAKAFLQIAWIGNFVMWFIGASIAGLFPKLARSLTIDDRTIGLVIAAVTVAQGVTFYLMSRTRNWHYRMRPLMTMQCVTLLGLLVVVFGDQPAVLGVAMALIGLGRGMTYTCSLFYGLEATRGGGASTGFHEFLIGFGFVSGPFLSGLAAEHFGLRAPFILCFIVLVAGMAIQVAIWKRLSHGAAEDKGARPE
ncbi:MAG: MFS transporter [Armatimonadetes bacterium]|nr:MFS transporter [Armatimonadota bacterium]